MREGGGWLALILFGRWKIGAHYKLWSRYIFFPSGPSLSKESFLRVFPYPISFHRRHLPLPQPSPFLTPSSSPHTSSHRPPQIEPLGRWGCRLSALPPPHPRRPPLSFTSPSFETHPRPPPPSRLSHTTTSSAPFHFTAPVGL